MLVNIERYCKEERWDGYGDRYNIMKYFYIVVLSGIR